MLIFSITIIPLYNYEIKLFLNSEKNLLSVNNILYKIFPLFKLYMFFFFLFFSSNPCVMTWTTALRFHLRLNKSLSNQLKVLNKTNANHPDASQKVLKSGRLSQTASWRRKFLIHFPLKLKGKKKKSWCSHCHLSIEKQIFFPRQTNL